MSEESTPAVETKAEEPQKVPPKGLQCKLSDERSILAWAFDDGSVLFEFQNKDVKSKVRLSGQAIEAVMQLYLELRVNGFSA